MNVDRRTLIVGVYRISSVTVWNTQAQADAWYTSPEYADLIKGVGPLLASTPERHHFIGHRETLKAPPGA